MKKRLVDRAGIEQIMIETLLLGSLRKEDRIVECECGLLGERVEHLEIILRESAGRRGCDDGEHPDAAGRMALGRPRPEEMAALEAEKWLAGGH